MRTIESLIDSYIKYIKMSFDIEKINNNTYEIVTPFLDRHNDNISIYTIIENDNIKITDDGYTLSDLKMSGIDIDKERRKKEIGIILNGYGTRVDEITKEIFTIADDKNYASKQHNILQAIMNINDLYLTSKETVKSLFIEEIANFFDESQITYVQNVALDGKSGFTHKIDYVIPKNIRENKKEAIIKAVNAPKKTNIESALFSMIDIERDDDKYILYNDIDHTISDEAYKAIKKYNITPLSWSDKNSIKQQLLAA